MSQLPLDFDPRQQPTAAPAAARKPRAPARSRAQAAPAAATPAMPTPEEMARQLDAHPDYRVLRRLVPVCDYGPMPAPVVQESGAAAGGVRQVLVLDTETTGLVQAQDRIIELAMLLVAVDLATGLPCGPVQTFEGFEDPGMPIPPVARQITGIDDAMVQGQRLDDARVLALLARCDLVVAHNAGFDRPFVEARFPAFAHKPWACSFQDIAWKAQGAESARLGALALDRGWFYDAHRALVDCHALLQVLACSAAGAAGGPGHPSGEAGTGAEPVAAGTLLQLLFAAAEQPRYRLRATGAPFESKDKLKARAYRWDAEVRVWHCSLSSADALAQELDWLRAEVYGSRRAQVELETLDALTRYSTRRGVVQSRSL